ncbi:DEAD/DEAH box helicase [Propionibacterium freudenreichii]|uniref:DEAD/DEAH box helicase n=1 Tax=Propionibacterium freudenreichii TaxID=1744 RepID=UPI0011093797|nr:DEAD/DEAH box helicase [Propionibacterium freudenreichii]MCT2975511.1 DEAD/DEAH box helicase [Propionibacterium freudenreichii]MDK9350048.1 DEAD/DEAH box helicase [Propionibacterium freudenreichii]
MAIPQWLAGDLCVLHVDHRDALPGTTAEWPEWLSADCVATIRAAGVPLPWRHQREAAELAHAGRHVALSTPTASGKTLAYLLPLMAATAPGAAAEGFEWADAAQGDRRGPSTNRGLAAALVADHGLSADRLDPGLSGGGLAGAGLSGEAMVGSRARATTVSRARSALGLKQGATALYLAPTKALAHDQMRAARTFGPKGWQVGCLDGDSDAAERRFAREQADMVLTNPDMVHHALLPGHARWARLLSGLRYVVIDEAHRYRGVFGAQVGGVIRRLRRLCHAYGSDPVFILASATASHAGESGAALIGEPEPIAEVNDDASPHPARDVVLWRPESSAYDDAAKILAGLVDQGRQTIAFVASRAQCELMAVRAKEKSRSGRAIASYRSGYLAMDRRQIEAGLQSGRLFGVSATNALELGVDVAGMDAVVICGFPGTLASLWQQAGRAGRADRDALVVVVQREDPLDAYLFAHPELIFSAPIEHTVLFPDNPHVLGPQLAAAAQEAPLTPADARWFGPTMAGLCEQLCAAGLLRRRATGWYWPRPERAVDAIDLRGTGGKPLDIIEEDSGRVIGQVDMAAADHSVYPGAVYLHQGEQFLVDAYHPERREALVNRRRPGYFTQPRTIIEARILHEDAHKSLGRTTVCTGDIDLTTQVTGYLRRDEVTTQVWDENPLELPVQRMGTKAVWWTVPEDVAAEVGLSAIKLANAAHAMEHTAIGLLPGFAPCDRWDIGGVSMMVHPDTELCTIIVHDGQAGGSGFARAGYECAEAWLAATLQRLQTCSCLAGCPACIVSPKCGNGNQHLDKDAATRLLAALLEGPAQR